MKTIERATYTLGGLLLLSGLIHLAVLLIIGSSWEGPLSLRKPTTFGLSFGLTLINVTLLCSFVSLSNRTDTLNRFEIFWRYPAQAAVFFFGLVNAGVPFGALEDGAWGLPIAVIIGKPLGVLGAGLAVSAGLHLPQRIGWRELIVIGFTAAVGFSVGLFLARALVPPGQLRSEVSMGCC